MFKKLHMKAVKWAYSRIKRLYGDFDETLGQFPAYRCVSCNRVITWKHIGDGSGCFCGSVRVSPTNFTFFEEMRLLFMPWSFKSGMGSPGRVWDINHKEGEAK